MLVSAYMANHSMNEGDNLGLRLTVSLGCPAENTVHRHPLVIQGSGAGHGAAEGSHHGQPPLTPTPCEAVTTHV